MSRARRVAEQAEFLKAKDMLEEEHGQAETPKPQATPGDQNERGRFLLRVRRHQRTLTGA
jgi:hypothetical protein